MGRELKRVALDFVWPENKVWEGFINPHYMRSHDCKYCGGTGSSPDALRLKNQWYGNAPFKPEDRGSKPFTTLHPAIEKLARRNVHRAPSFFGGNDDAAERREALRLCGLFNSRWCHHLNAGDVAALINGERLHDLMREYRDGKWVKKDPPHIPTPEEVNAWSISGMGHDAINQWIVVGAECKRLVIPSACDHCKGEGSIWETPEDKAAAEAWEPTEPPAGDGYQIWETVSDGSPISPVFATAEELARHMAGKKWGADKGSSYETWLAFINGPGWSPSMIMDSSGLRSGPDAGLCHGPV